MNDIITARDPDIIAAEINMIKSKVRQVVIYSSIEIGGKLVEAKSLVNHGEWGKWLEQNVEYSQSTADYLMKLYQEYGTGQENLFDTWTNSQTFAKLTYSQHIALLALPFGERQEFSEQNHVEDMSTRQLQQAIRERDEAIQSQKDAEEAAKEFNAQLRQANAAMEQANADKEKAQKDKSKAEKSEKTALNLVKKLEKQLDDAKTAEKAAIDELKKVQENPTVPDAIMEQMRAEVAADAAKEATEKIQKQLDAALADKESAEKAVKAAEEKLADAQKAAKTANPIITEAIVRAQKLQNDFNELNGFRLKQAATDPTIAESIKRIMSEMVAAMRNCIS